jgi:hypothetical protein
MDIHIEPVHVENDHDVLNRTQKTTITLQCDVIQSLVEMHQEGKDEIRKVINQLCTFPTVKKQNTELREINEAISTKVVELQTSREGARGFLAEMQISVRERAKANYRLGRVDLGGILDRLDKDISRVLAYLEDEP